MNKIMLSVVKSAAKFDSSKQPQNIKWFPLDFVEILSENNDTNMPYFLDKNF